MSTYFSKLHHTWQSPILATASQRSTLSEEYISLSATAKLDSRASSILCSVQYHRCMQYIAMLCIAIHCSTLHAATRHSWSSGNAVYKYETIYN